MRHSIDFEEYTGTITNPRKRHFIEKAIQMGVEISIVSSEFRVLKLRFDNKERIMFNEQIYLNKRPSGLLARNKEITKLLLTINNIQTPPSIFAETFGEAMNLIKANNIMFPVVVKPVDGTKGLGVSLNVRDFHEIEIAMRKIEELRKKGKLNCSPHIMVEEMRSGHNFRILVLDDDVIACVERIPAHIVGDGESTICEIIERFNLNRPESFRLTIDQEVGEAFSKNQLDINSVLQKGEKVVLREIANLSSGGVAIDKTEEMSKRFRGIAVESARALDINYCGIDLIADDIASNDPNQKYHVIEINSRPDFEMHEKPVVRGKGVDVTKLLVKHFMDIE